MNIDNPQEELYSQMSSLLDSLSVLHLPFYDDFKTKWRDILYSNTMNPLIRAAEYTSESQLYTTEVSFASGFKFPLHFDISNILRNYQKETKYKKPVFFYPFQLKVQGNKKLTLNSHPCAYNYTSREEREESYNTHDPIFVSLMPLIPHSFFVVDGNHRVSALVDKKEKSIDVLLIEPNCAPCFMISSAEMVAYTLMLDVFIIMDAIKSRNVSGLREKLSVFNDKSMLSTLKETERLR